MLTDVEKKYMLGLIYFRFVQTETKRPNANERFKTSVSARFFAFKFDANIYSTNAGFVIASNKGIYENQN